MGSHIAVKRLISQRGVEVHRLAGFLKLPLNKLQDMLNGTSKWPLKVLMEVADFFDVELSDLT